jgi:hypothetical protein
MEKPYEPYLDITFIRKCIDFNNENLKIYKDNPMLEKYFDGKGFVFSELLKALTRVKEEENFQKQSSL